MADALLDALGDTFTIACPAFPEHGRTIYNGHLLVGDAPLCDSTMRHHPLTPMTDANLVRVLQRQTPRKVGLTQHAVVRRGAEAIGADFRRLRDRGCGYAVVDALADDDLLAVGAACADLRLVTAGSGDAPTKETLLHLAIYRRRPSDGAVVHLHTTHSVAVSVLADVEAWDALPPLTAYYVMRVGRLPLVPYHPPGDPALADAVEKLAGECHALLLANHGPVVSGATRSAASDAIEELEATARVFLLTYRQRVRPLTPDQVEELRRRFGGK